MRCLRAFPISKRERLRTVLRLLTAPLLATAISAHATCYQVYRGQTLVYHSQVPPVDLSLPYSETVPALFGPDASMVVVPGAFNCPSEAGVIPAAAMPSGGSAQAPSGVSAQASESTDSQTAPIGNWTPRSRSQSWRNGMKRPKTTSLIPEVRSSPAGTLEATRRAALESRADRCRQGRGAAGTTSTAKAARRIPVTAVGAAGEVAEAANSRVARRLGDAPAT